MLQRLEKDMNSLQSPRARWFALALIVAAQFMVVLDVAIVNVALPSIKTDLDFSQENLQWVITAYSILFGGALLLGGRLADIIGRRRMFLIGLAIFTGSSLLNGLAWSETSLIVFRTVQGLGAALLSPAALSILTTTFREGRDRNVALGIWGAASGSGGAAGVLLGGALTSAFSWSWIFFINVPAGIAVMALTPFLLRESKAELEHRHFDALGAVSITGGLMLLVYALTRAAQHGWVTAESNISGLRLSASLFSQFFLLTLYMQQVLHYSALKTGVAYIGLTLTIIAFSGVAQALATRVGVRPVLTAGMLVAAAALLLYSQLPVGGHYFWDLFPAFVPMSIGALTGVTQDEAGVASGLINTSQQVGGAIGVAVATTIATTYTAHFVDAHAGATALGGAALTHGFQITFYVLAGFALAGAVAAGLLIERKPKATDEVVVDGALLEAA
jgi:MFS family permease